VKADREPVEGGESPTDGEIIRRVLAGDPEAFEPIMRRYNRRLFRVVRSIVGHDAEAEDVLQECYLRAFEHLDQFEGRSRFSTWLTRIAVYEASARRRRNRRMRFVDLNGPELLSMEPVSRSRDAEAQASGGELRDLLRRAIDTLPVQLRAVLVMRLVEGLDTDETAECLGLTEANVKVRLHRARALLRQRIDEQVGQEVRQLYQFDGARCDRIVRGGLNRLSQDWPTEG
jgi:RNA polymerase sigma-70 factor (ECF subfamily)